MALLEERYDLADEIETLRVGGGIAAGCPTDGRVIDLDELVDGLEALDPGQGQIEGIRPLGGHHGVLDRDSGQPRLRRQADGPGVTRSTADHQQMTEIPLVGRAPSASHQAGLLAPVDTPRSKPLTGVDPSRHIERVEGDFLVFLHVLGIGQRQALHHRQKRDQVAVDAPGLGAHQFGGDRQQRGVPLLKLPEA